MTQPTAAIPVSEGRQPLWRQTDAWVALLLIVGTIAVFWPCGRLGFVDFDDPVYVLDNPHTMAGLNPETAKWAAVAQVDGNWHPLTMLSHLLDVRLFGPAARPMHLENVLLHAINTAGWYLLLTAATGRRGCAAMVAGLFAVHPMHVESVAWISERKDVLSTALLLASMIAYVAYVKRRSRVAYAGMLLAFVLALLAKPMVVTEPFLLLLLDYWPLRRWAVDTAGGSKRARGAWLVVEKLPLFFFAAADGVIAIVAQRQSKAIQDLTKLGLRGRVANACIHFVRYLAKLSAPLDLSPLYPFRWNEPTSVALASAALLLMISALLFSLRRRRPYLLMGWAWFGVALLPVIGLVQVGRQSIADRYTYVPSIGLFVAVAWEGAAVIPALIGRRWAGRVCTVLATAVLIPLTVLTRWQIPIWTDSVTLFTRAAAVTEDSFTIEANLGDGYLNAGRVDQAIEHFGDADALAPGDVGVRRKLGNLLLGRDAATALPYLRFVARSNQATAADQFALGVCDERLHRSAAAVEAFRASLVLDPTLAQAQAELRGLNTAGTAR